MSYFLNAEHHWSVWHEVLKGPKSRYRLSKYSTPDDFIGNWEGALERRVQEASECLSRRRGVVALILGGGIGKGEPWPLSDIDIIGVFRHDEFERTKHEVRKERTKIEERWVHEGFPTNLDIRSIVFTDREVEGILAADSVDFDELLKDDRWFHGLDKAANGRVIHDRIGVVDSFLANITELRYSEDVVSRRRRRRGGTQPSCEDVQKVRDLVAEGTLIEANLAFRTLVYRFVGFLYAGKWDNSGKLGRNCTRFEREGQSRGVGESSSRLIRLIENPSDSHKRLNTAPHRVRDRHRISWPARSIIGEEVTAEEDARDVLDFFTNLRLPKETGRYPVWTGIRTARATLKNKFAELVEVLQDYPWV